MERCWKARSWARYVGGGGREGGREGRTIVAFLHVGQVKKFMASERSIIFCMGYSWVDVFEKTVDP